ncbi:MAG: hypothetical protein V2B19_13775 [Pseudomonadota bacterium]
MGLNRLVLHPEVGSVELIENSGFRVDYESVAAIQDVRMGSYVSASSFSSLSFGNLAVQRLTYLI